MPFITTAFLVNLAVAAALTVASNLLRPKPKKPDTASLDFSQSVAMQLSYNVPKEVLVGKRATGGMGAYIDTHSTKNENLVRVQVISAKPCTAFHTAIFDAEPVALSGDPTTGEVNISDRFLGKNDVPRAKMRVFLGDDNSGLGAYLSGITSGKFAATDNFNDCCVIVQQFRNTNDDIDTESGESFIPFQGPPQGKFILDGVKVCDPRIAGSVYTDESTYVFSDNPALIHAQADYGWRSGSTGNEKVIVGNGYDVAQIPTAEVIANADYCETKGFTCAGRMRSQNQSDIEEVLRSFNAVRVRRAAYVYALPEGRRDPAITIDFKDHPAARLVSPNRQGFSPDVYNVMRTYYAEPAEQYGKKDLPVRDEQAFLDEDNGLIREKEFSLNYVVDSTQAINLEDEELLGSRAAASVIVADLPPKYGSQNVLKEGGRVIFQNTPIAWINGVEFAVNSRAQGSDLDVTLVCREYAGDAAYAGRVNPPTVTPIIPPVRPWEFRTAPGVPDAIITDLQTVNSQLTANAENINTAIAGSGAGGLTASMSASSVGGDLSSPVPALITSSAVTVTPSGGTGPYTQAWTKLSGDPSNLISADSPAALTTTFSATLPADELATAVFKVTITDNVSATFSLNVSVALQNTHDGF